MTSRLRAALAAPDSKSRYVRRLFSTIAERYDLITRVLSYGQDRRWKARLVKLSAARPGLRALDLACGTGDIAFALASRGANVVGLDITHRMVQLARTKGGAARFVTGDMLALPFGNEAFDIVTTGYGLRNVPDIPRAVAEMRRVLKPGGVALVLEFSRVAAPLAPAYDWYSFNVLPRLGKLIANDAASYRYLAESIRVHPDQQELGAMMESAGFECVEWFNLSAGVVALHRGHVF